MAQQGIIIYMAKHAFTGDVRQSQLTFPKGATLNAKPNQSGAWWWGSYNGKEGWFPPAYVTALGGGAPTPPGVAGAAPLSAGAPVGGGGNSNSNNNMSMQQRMAQASFAPSLKQQQQQQLQQPGAFGAAGFMPQQQQQPGAFGQMPSSQPNAFGQPVVPNVAFGRAPPVAVAAAAAAYQPADPFAGLDNAPLPSLNGFGAAPAAAAAAAASQPQHPLQQPTMASSSTGMSMAPTSTTASASAAPKPVQQQPPMSVDPTAAALARMGISSKSTTTTTTSKSNGSSNNQSPSAGNAVPTSATSSLTQPKSTTTTTPRQVQQQQQQQPASAKPTQPPKPITLSKEEAEARRKREQEEAALKAKIRREKEELRRETQEKSGAIAGIGSSGVALQTSAAGEVEVGLGGGGGGGGGGGAMMMMNNGGMMGSEPTFNPYDFLAGTTGGLPTRKFSPIFRVPPFWALMNLETYVRRFPLTPEQLADRNAAYQQLAKALSFLCHVVAESEDATKKGRGRFAVIRSRGATQSDAAQGPLAFLSFNHLACEACVKLISLLPHSAGASGKALDGLFLNFLNVFVSLMENLQPNQQLVLPGGWQQPDYHHLCLYIVRNCGNERFSFTVCNTGKDGLQYHPNTFDPETGRQLKQLALTVWNIPANRLKDSTFWTLLFRMQVYPSKANTAIFLYEKLLPALNAQPLRSNLDQGPAEYLEMPDPISASTYHPLARLAMTTTPQMGARPSKYSSLLLMNAAADLAYAEVENAPPASMDPEDTRILKLTGRNLANFASTLESSTVGDGTLGQSLSSTWDLLDKLHKKISSTASRAMDQYSHGLSKSALSDEFSKGSIKSMRTDAGSAAFPLFGRLRRDDYENVVKKLMGDPRPDPILIPAVLTDEELPHTATDFMTASSSLQRVADACSLLLQQRRLIKNAPAFAASAAQYAITVMLPMPHSDPKYCFWRKSPMRRETQVNLLFLLRRMCRIYSAATTCVQKSRGLVAIRSITLACGACIADAICRVKASDDPSAFALHYSGLCEGPTQPFAIEAGSFDTLGSNLPIYDPNLCSLRFRCLDYLREMTFNERGIKRPTIFNFDNSMTPMDGDVELLTQLSIQLALVRPYPATDEALINHSASLISGKNGSIMEVLPEFEYFRDIVFHFKHAVSGKGQTAEDVAPTKTWLPSDATLHWSVKRKEKDKDDPRLFYRVRAFNDHPQEFVEIEAQEPTFETHFKGFMSLFSSKQLAVRERLSSADPTTVVNSCGDKFLQKKKYVDDIVRSVVSLYAGLRNSACF